MTYSRIESFSGVTMAKSGDYKQKSGSLHGTSSHSSPGEGSLTT